MKESIINAITNEKINEIKDLKEQIKAKEIQIYDLKMLEGELKSKEKTITVLNRENDTLK